MEEIN